MGGLVRGELGDKMGVRLVGDVGWAGRAVLSPWGVR